MKAAETAAGKRLVDYLDLHWYPEAQRGQPAHHSGTTRRTRSVAAARAGAALALGPDLPRDELDHRLRLRQPIRLIPRMRDKIAAHYPGTKLAFTEWNYGGGGHIRGGVATADVLGIFGREGVGMAAYWALDSDESFTYAAFRAFRNYDGAGATFGDTSIHAGTSDVATATVYASIDAADPDRVVIVAINKATTAKIADIVITHPVDLQPPPGLDPDRGGRGAHRRRRGHRRQGRATRFRYTMPALSVSVLVPGA